MCGGNLSYWLLLWCVCCGGGGGVVVGMGIVVVVVGWLWLVMDGGGCVFVEQYSSV